MKRILLSLLLLSTLALTLQAHPPVRPTKRAAEQATLTDSLAAIGLRYLTEMDSLRKSYLSWNYTQSDLLENPYYFPLFAGATFYNFPLQSQIGALPSPSVDTPLRPIVTEEVARMLLTTYATSPQLFQHDLSNLPKDADPEPKPKKEAKPAPAPKPAVAPTKQEEFVDPNSFQLFVRRPNFWNFRGSFSTQFMQYYVSENWYKGGEDHNSIRSELTLEANYDNKQKLTFTNKLEMKLGFKSSEKDSERRYKTNTDLLRMTNKLGLKAVKNWYYTLSLQSWTQFYPGYNANDTKVYSDFMSPFESLFSIGMDYKYSKRNFEVTAALSPLAAKFKYVDRLALSTRFGLEAEKHSRIDLGSTMTIDTKWNVTKDIQWKSRLYFFTNYEQTQAEWENTISLKVNKYLSSKLFLHPRFDDGVKRKDDRSYFQFHEYLSVGLDLSF